MSSLAIFNIDSRQFQWKSQKDCLLFDKIIKMGIPVYLCKKHSKEYSDERKRGGLNFIRLQNYKKL